MRDDLNERISLNQRFQKLMSLGIWSDKVPQPDPQTLERIERLNNDIQRQIFELYLDDRTREMKIKQIKKQLHQEYKQRNKKATTSPTKKVEQQQFRFMGEEVSNWMKDYHEDTEQLEDNDLPSLPKFKDLAELVDTKPKRLMWLFYHSEFTDTVHYEDFSISKGTGRRQISKPCDVVNNIQQLLKKKLLDKLDFPHYVHGFVQGHNIYDNARAHTNCRSLITMDIEDFFGSINFAMVRRAFGELGYSGQIATVLALIVTKQEFRRVEIDGREYWKGSQSRYLPQGSATSPDVSNLIARRFDNQLRQRADNLDFTYTRYADDLTFSTSKDGADHRAILYLARKTLELHGFTANDSKTKILFPHHQQQVTGLNLNSGKPTVPRKWRRNLRAAVHQFRFIEDPEEKEAEYLRIMGCLQHLKLSHPQKAKQYEIEINRYYQLT